LIDKSRAFAYLPFEVRLELAKACREVRFAKDQRIFSATEPPREILIVAEGRAKLIGVTEDGVPRILYVYGVGEVIGSRVLLKESPESPFDVIAMEPVHAVAISKKDFMRIQKVYPEVLVALSRILIGRVERLTSTMLAAMSDNALIRLGKILVDFVDHRGGGRDGFIPLDADLTHETLGQLIGTTRPHTTKLIQDLERLGGVQRQKTKGLLVNRARLESLMRENAKEDVA
jgi:CRP-like cAMP-binding protein